MNIFTIGHSNRTLEIFVALLRAYSIEQVIDIRTIPKSAHNPQFGQQELSRSLRNRGIGYRHLKALGGLRKPRPDSTNTAWKNASFRGYADYMQTPEFDAALGALIALSEHKTTTIMCAEAVPWRCHRSLVADALAARGVAVKEILSLTGCRDHNLTGWAKVEGTRVTYPGLV